MAIKPIGLISISCLIVLTLVAFVAGQASGQNAGQAAGRPAGQAAGQPPGPDFREAYQEAQVALSVQKWDRAAKLLTTVLEKKPDFLPALLERALAYSKLGEYDRSIQDLEKVVQINPDLPDPYGMLGVVYEIKKDYASALKVYRNALPRVKNPEVKKILDKWIADTEAKVKAKK